MYVALVVAFIVAYLGHYLHHGFDLVELVSLVVGVAALVFLAFKEWRASK